MCKLVLLGLILELIFSHAALAKITSPAKNSTVLIYRGTGACHGCADAAAAIPTSMGFDVRFVTAKSLTEASFENVVLWIQPGGNALKAAPALGKNGLAIIRKQVRYNGMGYLGLCAGAFLSDTTIDYEDKIPGLGLIPFDTPYYEVDSGRYGILIPLELYNSNRYLFFNGGGTFVIKDGHRDYVDIIAKYPNGEPAIIQTRYGKGNVVLTGAHPEATEEWKKYTNMKDPDGSDLDIAIDLFKRALPEKL